MPVLVEDHPEDRQETFFLRNYLQLSLLQGITLKLNEKQSCTVARILHGGMIHRQGTLSGALGCVSFTSVARDVKLIIFKTGSICACVPRDLIVA